MGTKILRIEDKLALEEVTDFLGGLTQAQQEKFILMVQAAKWTMELLKDEKDTHKEIS